MEKRSRRPHGLHTKKISVSISADDLKTLSARARRVHRGNLSAVVHEMVATLKREEALDSLFKELGADQVSEAAMDGARAELAAVPKVKRRRRRAA